MQFSKMFAKLISIDSPLDNLPSKKEPTRTITEDRLRLQNDAIWPDRIIKDQKLLRLYKVMDMGA